MDCHDLLFPPPVFQGEGYTGPGQGEGRSEGEIVRGPQEAGARKQGEAATERAVKGNVAIVSHETGDL